MTPDAPTAAERFRDAVGRRDVAGMTDTMALADSRIERDLGIDGVSESVIYAAGVGVRPEKAEWAPWPDRAYGKRVPNLARRAKK